MIGLKVPIEAVSPRAAAASMAVVRGARSVREVAAACGFNSIASTVKALEEARGLGLIAAEPRTSGSLRPLVEVVANTPR